MSDIFRKSVLAKLPRLPPTRAPWADEEDSEVLDEEGDDELGEMSMGPPRSTGRDYTPLSGSSYFTSALEVNPPGNNTTFRVYLTPPVRSTTPSDQSPGDPEAGPSRIDKGTHLVCHHGAGSGGLSFALLAKEVKERSGGEMGVLAFDCRGHGKTRTDGSGEQDADLSSETLLSDFTGVIQHIFPDTSTSPSLLLLGHSMGAVPVISAAPVLQAMGYKIPGVIVLDVVEGTAMESLPIMKSILSKRPESFKSVEDSIQWHVQSNSIRNVESARVSVPSYLVPSDPAAEINGKGKGKMVWRTDLLATEPFWEGWYRGLSSRFLSAKCARLLVLAGQERLDKELMVGQMQGKFQLEVMSEVGHYLHEDDPASLAGVVVAFWRRNTRVLVLPPKIGSGSAAGLGGGVTVKRVGEA